MNGRMIIGLHDPQGETCRSRTEVAFGEPVPSATIDGLTVDTVRPA